MERGHLALEFHRHLPHPERSPRPGRASSQMIEIFPPPLTVRKMNDSEKDGTPARLVIETLIYFTENAGRRPEERKRGTTERLAES